MAHLFTAPVVDATPDNGFADSDRVSSAYLHHQESSYTDLWTDVDESSPQYQDGLKLFLECLVELDQLDASSPLRLTMEGGGPLFMSQHHLEDPQVTLPSARRQLNALTSSRFQYHEPGSTSPEGDNYNEHLSAPLPIAPVSKSTPLWSMSGESSYPRPPSFPIEDNLSKSNQPDYWNKTAVNVIPGSKPVGLPYQRQQSLTAAIWSSPGHHPIGSFSSSRKEKENIMNTSTTDAHGTGSGHLVPVEHIPDNHAQGRNGSEELPHTGHDIETKRTSRKRSHADSIGEDNHVKVLPRAKKSKATVVEPSSKVTGSKRNVKRPIQVQSALPEMMAEVADGVEIVEASEIENDGIINRFLSLTGRECVEGATGFNPLPIQFDTMELLTGPPDTSKKKRGHGKGPKT
ncbi:hypothetical protein JR316_0009594 [Psilocybe cubensis]|uniref:Uncharacterized protein n=1 Tax=Psilocybe cubensis TaxID=181762 RepID=A0ACB8GP76_PSICU|nr:hypothetical protein JR316_0009594 [Psilocybe cubensis]KAH9477384.1 hypothetical protein JR316_0009594 [Psilocybe cubensis]